MSKRSNTITVNWRFIVVAALCFWFWWKGVEFLLPIVRRKLGLP